MKNLILALLIVCAGTAARGAELPPPLSPAGKLTYPHAHPDTVLVLERADHVAGPWEPFRNFHPSASPETAQVQFSGDTGFFRKRDIEIPPTRDGFLNYTRAFSTLTTIAGKGENLAAANGWLSSYEGGPATAAELSRPHIAMASTNNEVFIADKDAHAIRKVLPDGTIHTVVGTGAPGNGPDQPTPGTSVALNEPNGLWVTRRGIVYVLDLGNGKVRKLGPGGQTRTVFTVPGGIASGRGLWMNEDETLGYLSSGSQLLKWTPTEGVTTLASGFSQLGNIAVDSAGRVIATDRNGHRVYRVEADGSKTAIAGNGTRFGGGDGMAALETGLNQVRAVWSLPNDTLLLGTDDGSQVWYMDQAGILHLLLHGNTSHAHAGDGAWFYNPTEPRVSKVRQITVDYEGNLLITEHDGGFIRKVRFLPPLD